MQNHDIVTHNENNIGKSTAQNTLNATNRIYVTSTCIINIYE